MSMPEDRHGAALKDRHGAALKKLRDAAQHLSGQKEKAEAAIWAAVLINTATGVVPFGINVAWDFAVFSALIVYLGELYGFTYSKAQAGELIRHLLKTLGFSWGAWAFSLKFMAEGLKGLGILTMGGATAPGMALDAVVSGAITYAVGYTTLTYLERERDLSTEEIRAVFRTRLTEGRAKVRAAVGERAADTRTGMARKWRQLAQRVGRP